MEEANNRLKRLFAAMALENAAMKGIVIMRLLPILALLTSTFSFAEELTVATFNAEFLVLGIVHIKYGIRYDMSDFTEAESSQ